MLRALVTVASVLALLLVGCNSFPDAFICSADIQCTRIGASGQCLAGACAFADTSCDSDLRYDETAMVGGGECVPGGGPRDSGVGDSGMLLNDCGGESTLPNRYLDPCGNCLLGRWQCDGLDALVCAGDPRNETIVTGEGSVTASTTFSSTYPARSAIDGDLTTSWFSSGPETAGPSIFDWTISSNECIVAVSIHGNGRHAMTSFREDFGFGNVEVQVLDGAGGVQASESRALPGTPDPQQDVDFDAYGRTVRLRFTGHESDDCGGFSELVVTVAR